MAFPAVQTTNTTGGNSAATNKACNLPASIAAGDLLLLIIRSAGTGGNVDTHTTPQGWSDLVKNNLDDGSDDTTSIFYKQAAGDEGASVTVNGTASLKFASLSWRISGHENPALQAPEISTAATGTSTTPQPNAISPAGGAKDFLFLWIGGWEGEQTSPPASNPTDYTSNIIGANSGVGGATATNCRCASASRQANVTTETPGSWTISASEDWTAWVVVIFPSTVVPLVEEQYQPQKQTLPDDPVTVCA